MQWLYLIFPIVFFSPGLFVSPLKRSILPISCLPGCLLFIPSPRGECFCIPQPTLGSYTLSIPFLSLFVCMERLFCWICDLLQRFSRRTIAYISSWGKNMASSPVTHCYGCIKYPYAPEILTSGSLKGKRVFHVFEGMRSFTIITQKIALSCHIISPCILTWNITTHNISEIRIFSFFCASGQLHQWIYNINIPSCINKKEQLCVAVHTFWSDWKCTAGWSTDNVSAFPIMLIWNSMANFTPLY